MGLNTEAIPLPAVAVNVQLIPILKIQDGVEPVIVFNKHVLQSVNRIDLYTPGVK